MSKVLESQDQLRAEDSRNFSLYRRYFNLAQVLICVAICGVSIGIFVYRALDSYDNPEPDLNGADFLYFYSGGVLWNQGLHIYDEVLFRSAIVETHPIKADHIQNIYYYLPPATVLFGTYAQLDYRSAYNLHWLLNLIMIGVSVVMLGVILSWFRPIGPFEIALLCMFLNTTYSRSTIEVGQLGALIFVILLCSFIFSRYNHWLSSAALVSLLIIKFSFLPLFVGYYLLRRHFRAFVLCVLLCAVLCVLPLILTQRPLIPAFENWLEMMKQSTRTGASNSASPFEPYSLELMNLEPLVYRVLNAQSPLTTAINWLLIGLLVLYSAYLITKHRSTTLQSRLLDFALVSMLCLISIYHRGYDLFLMFPALIYLYIHTHQQQSLKARWTWGLFTAFFFVLIMFPRRFLFDSYYTDPTIADTYLWRVLFPYQMWGSVILLAAVLWLKRRQVTVERAASLSPAPSG